MKIKKEKLEQHGRRAQGGKIAKQLINEARYRLQNFILKKLYQIIDHRIIEKEEIYYAFGLIRYYYLTRQTFLVSINTMATNVRKLKDTDGSEWKRSSIMNSIIMDKSQMIDRCQRSSQKQFAFLKKSKRMIFEMKDYKFEPFDLRQLQDNHVLVKNNRKFASLLNTLKIYNQKIIDGRQHDIVNYKLYDFFYSTLKICNTKTETEVEFYLKQVDHWLNVYTHKRQLIIRPNKKKNSRKGEDQQIRQTFKSTLPLQIDQYERKLCALPASKSKKIEEMGDYINQRDQKFKSTSGKMFQESEQSDSQKYTRKIRDSSQSNKNNPDQLPNLRAYKMQIIKMRKVIQEREEQKMIANLKKNQYRIQTQSSNNFYKPLRNRNDIFNKTASTFGIQQNLDEQKAPSREGQIQSRRTSKQLQTAKNADKENHKIIVNSTTMGFYQIKKKNLMNLLGSKKSDTPNSLPKFFMSSNQFYNKKNEQISQAEQISQVEIEKDVVNIEGLNLMKNPFQLAKAKTKKKK